MFLSDLVYLCFDVLLFGLSAQSSANAYFAIQPENETRYIIGPLISLLILGLIFLAFHKRSDR